MYRTVSTVSSLSAWQDSLDPFKHRERKETKPMTIGDLLKTSAEPDKERILLYDDDDRYQLVHDDSLQTVPTEYINRTVVSWNRYELGMLIHIR